MNLSLKSIKKLNPVFILIILIIILLFASWYFLMKPLENGTKTLLQPTSPYKYDSTPPDSWKGDVGVDSGVSAYKIAILSQKRLVDLLFSWGIFNKKYNFSANGQSTSSVNKVVFELTPQKQKYSLIDFGQEGGQSSVDVYAKDNQLNVKIYISDKAFSHSNDFVEYQALYLLYYFSHVSPKIDFATATKDYTKLFDTKLKNDPLFVVYNAN